METKDLTKSQIQKIEKLYKGNSKTLPIKDPRKIAKEVNTSRRTVMKYLESVNLATYSPGSYN